MEVSKFTIKIMTHIKYKVTIIAFFLILVGCSNQLQLTNIVGTYKNSELMLYEKLVLRTDSTYTYEIEGDMYPYPIKQEGFWALKNRSIKLSALKNYKKLNVSYSDSITKYNLFFRFFDIEGKPIYDFTGNLVCNEVDSYMIEKVQENLYKVALNKECNNVIIENQSNLYENFSLNLNNLKGNIFNVHLFVKNELQKDQWHFKFKDEALHYKKRFVYKKISN